MIAQRYFVNMTGADGRRWEVWFAVADGRGVELTYKPWRSVKEVKEGLEVEAIPVPMEVQVQAPQRISELIAETAGVTRETVYGRRTDNKVFD